MAKGNSTASSDSTSRSSSRSRHHFDDEELEELMFELEDLAQKIQPLKELLSQATLDEQQQLKMPTEFVKAWLHVVMSLILAARESDLYRGHLRKARKLIGSGIRSIMQSFVRRSLLRDSIVMPTEIATLVHLNLLRGTSSGRQKREIAQVYIQHLNKLVSLFASVQEDT